MTVNLGYYDIEELVAPLCSPTVATLISPMQHYGVISSI